MTSGTGAGGKLPEDLKNDNRDVADLWKDALKSYKGIVGFDLERKFDNVDSMIAQGTKEMNNFHKFRHNEKKVDKLRSLFAANLDYLEKGAQQLIAAAVPAFPPAAAIGTALTYMLSVRHKTLIPSNLVVLELIARVQACRQVSADYDIVVVFFEDMNSFLQRIVILETRLPKYKAYQNCLMDVFTSFLTMCGFAHKYIELGRFKKWITNLMQGEDSDLGGARKNMDKQLSRLQNATEFAILGNTEELQIMSLELQKNQQSHTAMLVEQKELMSSIRDTTENIRSDMTKLLKAFEEQKKDRSKESKGKASAAEQSKPSSAKRIRNSLPLVEGDEHEYHILKETMVDDTCTWVFSEPQWEEWLHHEDIQRPILAITGQPGTGKSHIGAAVYNRLLQHAQEDTSKRTCATHFYFREQQQSLSSFINAVITVINQVVEQSSPLCELINTEFLKDELDMDLWSWKDLVDGLLAPTFRQGSKNRLFILFDGIDELDSLPSLAEFFQIIKDKNLRIYVAFTSRPSAIPQISETTPILSIEVAKEKQMSDLKALVWNRLNTLSALRKFGRYVKQRVADKVEEAAPNMLYAEHMLSRFNNLGREGAVLHNLNRPLPADLDDLYESLLQECHRRTTSNYQELVTKLLHWVTFAFRPLVLDEVVALLGYFTDDPQFDIEEIPEPFDKFIRVGDPGSDAEARAKFQSQGGWNTTVKNLEKSQDSSSPEQVYNDGGLPVKFQERSMRGFFQMAPEKGADLHWGQSEAHRQIFLASANIASPATAPKLDHRLRRYATQYLIHHWRQINPEEHSASENAEVMEAFGVTMSNQHNYVTMLEWHGPEYKEKFTDETFQKIARWAKLLTSPDEAKRPQLSDTIAEWWDGLDEHPHKCLLQLAKGHIQRLYTNQDLSTVLVSYRAAQKAFEMGKMNNLLVEQAAKNFQSSSSDHRSDQPLSEKQGALGIAGVFENLHMDAAAYYAVALVLFDYKHKVPAEVTCKKALDLCDQTVTRVRCLDLMARIQLKRGHIDEAYKFMTDCMEHLDDESLSASLKRWATITKARIEVERGEKDAAAASFAKARSLDPATLTPGDVLEEELEIFVEDEDRRPFIGRLKSWSPLEKLGWIAWNYDDLGTNRHELLCDIAVETREEDYVIEIYKEVIGYLDNVNAGAPLRIDLSKVYLQVCGDLDQTRKTLDEVLDSSSMGWPYAVTEELPEDTLGTTINMQTDVLFRLFKESRDPVVKKKLLEEVKGLVTRPLALDVPPNSDTYILQRRIVLARMLLKLGPADEFQKTLQGVIHDCIEALRDNVGWNDADNLVLLAASLDILAKAASEGEILEKLGRVSRILLSARFSRLNPGPRLDDSGYSEDDSSVSSEEEEEDDDVGDEESRFSGEADGVDEEPPTNEGDLDDPYSVERYCQGGCKPSKFFSWWGGRVVYECITCFEGFLCEPCYEDLQADSRGEKPLKRRKYCGKDHDYIKGPIEGWQGVQNGKVVVEGEEPVEFDELLRQISEELCKEAWGSFWEG
ncbi:Fc.00g045780.m01.CDS01 [Cosmosporella sp. VM-42]